MSQLWSIIRPIAFYGICALHFYHSPVVRAFILVPDFSIYTLPIISKACQRNAVLKMNVYAFVKMCF